MKGARHEAMASIMTEEVNHGGHVIYKLTVTEGVT